MFHTDIGHMQMLFILQLHFYSTKICSFNLIFKNSSLLVFCFPYLFKFGLFLPSKLILNVTSSSYFHNFITFTFIYTHTRTHTHTHIFIYVCVCAHNFPSICTYKYKRNLFIYLNIEYNFG